MRKIMFAATLMMMTALQADISTTHPEVADIIAATGWSEEELLLGLSRLDNLYQNDMKTEAGRQRWHGPKMKTVIDTDYGTEAITYSDGETITLDHRKTAASSVKTANARITSRGVPAALAALRAKAAADAATTNTVTITIGGK